MWNRAQLLFLQRSFLFPFLLEKRMSIIEFINDHSRWMAFLLYKQNNGSFTRKEEKDILVFIEEKRYEKYYRLIKEGNFPTDYPKKLIVNKEGSHKKRVVYSFADEENIIWKFIAFHLYEYDDIFCDNCYAFRRGYGVKDAIRKFRGNVEFSRMYCYKADISNYFNSIDVELLLRKLDFVKVRDEELYGLFEKLLREDRVYDNDTIIREEHGAMAGTPCSPFFANVYLADMDKLFWDKRVPYFRYSDDILIFAETGEELEKNRQQFCEILRNHKLDTNESKVNIAKPGERIEFLGFEYDGGCIDLSDNTKRKLKAKIKRKADALRRWQRKKNLSADKAAIGFINTMNRKFYGGSDKAWDEDDFTWSRWFFPNINTDKSLKEIDEYMQEYIRYVVTGRHFKGNYRITYEQMKAWGYRSLVHEYYRWKKAHTIM